jgi:hypothetical protein
MVSIVFRVQVLLGLNVPVPLLVNIILPVGVRGVVAVSLTVAVQLVAMPVVTDAGLQLTVVVVLSTAAETLTVLLVPWLPEWTVSLGV